MTMTSPVFLCLACSSSPLPKPSTSAPFTTACCLRPICETCLQKNPRLRGYNPCLACLAGVAVVDKSRNENMYGKTYVPGPSGQSREQENMMFILGDSDEEDTSSTGPDVTPRDGAPPPYSKKPEMSMELANKETLTVDSSGVDEVSRSPSSRYYIQRGDTLLGISLKYGVDGRTICQLNSLPFSTLNTTPHLLHTRAFLDLPPTRHPLPPPPDEKELDTRARERAEKRFQFVTKEVDWRVAKVYVSLAEDDDEISKSEDIGGVKNMGQSSRSLETRAADQYFDDEEWVSRQGGTPRIDGFPPFTNKEDGRQRRTLARKFGIF